MILYDYHIHTQYSPDSFATLESVIKSAIDKGLKEICITDHVDNVFLTEYELPDFSSFLTELENLQKIYKNKLTVKFGAEISLSPNLVKESFKISNDYPFDFIIGSSHECNNIFLTPNCSYYNNLEKKAAYELYFQEVLNNVKTQKCFDVYGHLDYINRYAPYEDSSLSYFDYKNLIDEILKELVARDKGLEINLSGLGKYKLGTVHPSVEILTRYKELGGEILTVGSDAHTPNFVGDKFDTVYDIIKNVGFKYITTYEKRKKSFVKI